MDFKELAKQLRKPEGDFGVKVADNMNQGNAAMYQQLYEMLHLQNNDTILEIGFGNGKHIPELIERAQNIQYHGIDYSSLMVEEANKVTSGITNGSANVVQGNLSEMPYSNEYFDKIITVNTVYFWDNPERDLQEIQRVLKKGGALFLSFRPKQITDQLPFTQYGFTTYELPAIKKMLQDAGFKSLESTYMESPPVEWNGIKVTFGSHCVKGIK